MLAAFDRHDYHDLTFQIYDERSYRRDTMDDFLMPCLCRRLKGHYSQALFTRGHSFPL